MEMIHPKDVGLLDPETISFITLKNGNMIMVDNTAPMKPIIERKKIDFEQRVKNSLKISEKLSISYNKEENKNKINKKYNQNNENYFKKKFEKNDWNKVYQIEKSINISYLGSLKQYYTNITPKNIKDNYSRNNLKNKQKENISNTKNNSNANQKENYFDFTKTSNFYSSPNSNTNTNNLFNGKIIISEGNENNIIKNMNKNAYEEDKDENSMNDKLKKKSNYKERMEKLVGDKNKPSVNAVISLDIPSDIPFDINGIQRQFNMLITQLKRKKDKYQKNNDGGNCQRYYELYKNSTNKIYNGTFTCTNNRLKYFEEHRNGDKAKQNEIDLFEKNNYKKNSLLSKENSFNDIFYLNYKSDKDINKSNNFYTYKIINDYNSKKKHTLSYLLNDKARPSTYRTSIKNKINRKGFRHNSAIIYPSNKSNSKLKGNFFNIF
jgi:hypothetical protein